ncbi:hypothetical protein [Candidatus Accumulibacter sp. ACC003]|uniref:hypothetical protein n=1 Tax=Candidatus Accumulibacter sp. ACC003 TaxID=2823334 RepID=UPI0025BA9CD6|nr:hypothetical protein [Candidatus Accumulibacter sp. ACC003]
MESTQRRERGKKGKRVGQKPPLQPKDIWSIRIHLQNTHHVRAMLAWLWRRARQVGARPDFACLP